MGKMEWNCLGNSRIAGSHSFNVTGNWTNNGTYTTGSETVTFNGGSAQSIGGSSTTKQALISGH